MTILSQDRAREVARELAPFEKLQLLAKDVREAKVTTNIPKVAGPVADAFLYVASELDACIAELEFYASQQVLAARLDEAKEWKAHRPGDGFYQRRIAELEQQQAKVANGLTVLGAGMEESKNVQDPNS